MYIKRSFIVRLYYKYQDKKKDYKRYVLVPLAHVKKANKHKTVKYEDKLFYITSKQSRKIVQVNLNNI